MTTVNTATTKDKADTRETKIEGFITKLDSLVTRKDLARLAALRRLSAPPSRWGPDGYAAGVPLLPFGLGSKDIDRYLLVAGLYALWHQGRGEPSRSSGCDFGRSMRSLATKGTDQGAEPSEAVERRFSVLLASDGERLFHHLRQSIGQLSSAGIEVDFRKLLKDLFGWDHPDRYIQRRWAVSFWAQPNGNGTETETETT